MHYDSYGNGFFKDPAITKLDGSIIKPNRKMSKLDIAALNKMYPCENCVNKSNTYGKTKI